MRVFNSEIPKRELLRRVGNLSQVGGVSLLSHEDGYARGSRYLEFRTGSGFRFGVNVDRGMDPGYAEFNGASLAWLAPKIFPAPQFWENDDHAWVRFVLGGLCNTAGAQQMTALASPHKGFDGNPAKGRCGYGTRIPLMVISPFAKKNFIDHTLTDQTSVLKFVEDNWLGGQRIQDGGSFDTIAGTIENMFSF